MTVSLLPTGSGRPSISMEQLGTTGRIFVKFGFSDFHEILYFRIFVKIGFSDFREIWYFGFSRNFCIFVFSWNLVFSYFHEIRYFGFPWNIGISGFHKILYLIIFVKMSNKIQVSLKYDQSSRYFTCSPLCSCNHTSFGSSQNEKCIRQNLQRNSECILCSTTFFFENFTDFR